MSNHNYSQYSNKKHDGKTNIKTDPKNNTAKTAKPVEKPAVKHVSEVIDVVQTEVTPEVKVMKETVETVSLPNTVSGVVAGCAKLNVRAEPSIVADVVCVLDAMSEIEIDVEKSSREWFKICTATGIDGYCMRKFVEAHM